MTECAATTARRVLKIEADAIQQLSSELPNDFQGAVDAILACQGRVIVSGVGKSGHIARKISATLASTGTPSYFVHATEASHGDMGMLTQADFCLLISNSGETAELRDIVSHTRRFSIAMAAISSKSESTLMHAADYQLNLPQAPEACHIGMAPTTSTTLAIVLGDALAVALMQRRNFSVDDFRIFHPGGKLGAQMATVENLMHIGDSVPVVQHELSMPDTLITMTSKGFGIAAVCKNGQLFGIISDGDLRRNMHHLMEKTAGEIATQNPVTVQKKQFAVEALNIINKNKINALVVLNDDSSPIGVLNVHDLLRAGIA